MGVEACDEDIYEESQCRKPILYLLTAGATDHWCEGSWWIQWNAKLQNNLNHMVIPCLSLWIQGCCSLQLWRRFHSLTILTGQLNTTSAQEVIPHSALMSWPRKRRSIPPTRCGPQTLLCRTCWFAAPTPMVHGEVSMGEGQEKVARVSWRCRSITRNIMRILWDI